MYLWHSRKTASLLFDDYLGNTSIMLMAQTGKMEHKKRYSYS